MKIKQLLRSVAFLLLVGGTSAAADLNYNPEQGFSLRVKLPAEWPVGDGPLVEITDADGAGLLRLRADQDAVHVDLWTVIPMPQHIEIARQQKKAPEHIARMMEGRMVQSVPVELIDQSRTRELLIVVKPLNIDVYLDGVTVDQEWPLGLREFRGSLRLSLAEGVTAEYDLATPDAKAVAMRYGGAGMARAAFETFFGGTGDAPPHYRPQGRGMSVRDCMSLYHNGRVHLFFNGNRRPDEARVPKWLVWADTWEHISSTDLIHWEEHPTALEITELWEGGMWAGCVIHDGNEYLAFTAPWVFAGMENAEWGVRVHRSQDGIHFKKDQRTLPGVIMGDPEVFRMPSGGWGMITRGNHYSIQSGPPHDPTRGFAFYTSPDLETWTREEKHPFEFAETNCDCPHYFEMGGRSWFFASATARTAPALNGPWTDIPASSLGVPKTALWKDGRRLLIGSMDRSAVFHELILLPGDRLGEKFIDEMTPLTGELLDIQPRSLMGEVDVSGRRTTLKGAEGLAAATLDGMPQAARIRMTIEPNSNGGTFGMVVRGKGDFERGMLICFDPSTKTVSIGPVTKPGQSRARRTIEQVDGLDQPIALDVILSRFGPVDVEINNRRCLTFNARNEDTPDRVFLFANGADAEFRDLEIRPWQPVTTVKRYHAFE